MSKRVPESIRWTCHKFAAFEWLKGRFNFKRLQKLDNDRIIDQSDFSPSQQQTGVVETILHKPVVHA